MLLVALSCLLCRVVRGSRLVARCLDVPKPGPEVPQARLQ